jgi:hypothetical protein
MVHIKKSSSFVQNNLRKQHCIFLEEFKFVFKKLHDILNF